jgi:hypothetical protein
MNLYTNQLDISLIKINNKTKLKSEYAKSYLDFKLNELFIKRKIKPFQSKLAIIQKILKIKGYEKYDNIYTKGFIKVIVNGDINSISVEIDVKDCNATLIFSSFVTGLITTLNYYESRK